MPILHLPGCHGLAIVHSKSAVCKGCPVKDSCRQVALANLRSLNRQGVSVEDLLKHYGDVNDQDVEPVETDRPSARVTCAVDLTADQNLIVASMPKKAASIAKALMRRGINLKRELMRGRNPFTNATPAFLKIPCSMLMQSGFQKSELLTAFMAQNPHWNRRTAEGHVSVSFALLSGLDCIHTKSGRFTLKGDQE